MSKAPNSETGSEREAVVNQNGIFCPYCGKFFARFFYSEAKLTLACSPTCGCGARFTFDPSQQSAAMRVFVPPAFEAATTEPSDTEMLNWLQENVANSGGTHDYDWDSALSRFAIRIEYTTATLREAIRKVMQNGL